MCGIVGYVGAQQAAPLLLEGLARLEHRGYDSAGRGRLGPRGVEGREAAGRVRDLAEELPKRFAGKVGIGHTRWATHGPANDTNAHPHTDAGGDVAVVHNGIIDNAAALRRASWRDDGVDLVSDTDTEVLAHLSRGRRADTLEGRVSEALAGDRRNLRPRGDARRLPRPDRGGPQRQPADHRRRRARRCTSPPTSPRWCGYTTTVAHLEDGEMATVTASGFTTYRPGPHPDAPTGGHRARRRPGGVRRGRARRRSCTRRSLEQPEAAERVLRGRLDERFGTAHLGGLNMDARETRAIRRVKVLGCGSAYYVGQMGAALRRGAGADPGGRRGGQRVPLPQPDHRAGHALRRGQPVRRDHRHPARRPGDPAQGRPGDRAGQRRRQRDRARVRRRHLPARRSRGRGGVDQGADQHVPRVRAARAPARAGCATCRSPTAGG